MTAAATSRHPAVLLFLAGCTLLSWIWVPLLPEPYQHSRFLFMAVILLLCLGTLALRPAGITGQAPGRGWLLFGGLWLVSGFTAWGTTANLADFYYENARTLLYLVTFGVALLCMTQPGFLRNVYRLAGIQGLLHTAWAVTEAQRAGVEDAAGFLGNSNHLGLWLLLNLGLTAAGGWQETGRWRILAGLSVLVQLGGLWACGSMGAAVGTLAGASLGLLGWLRLSGARLRTRLVVVGICGGMLLTGGWLLRNRLSQFVTETDAAWEAGYTGIHNRSSSWEERVVMNHCSLRLLADHPLTGVGPGNWKIAAPGLGLAGYYSGLGTRFYLQAHHDFLEMAAERGLPGLLGFTGLFFLAGLSLLRTRTAEGAALLAGLGAYAVASCASFGFSRTEVFLLVVLYFARAAQLGSLRPLTMGVLRGMTWITLLLTAGIVALGLSRIRSELVMAQLMKAHTDQNAALVLRLADRAESPVFTLETLSSMPIGWYRAMALQQQGHLPEALAELERTVKIHPWNPQVLSMRATCYGMAGDWAQAVALQQECLRIWPAFESPAMNLLRIYVKTHRLPEATALARDWQGRAQNPDFAEMIRIVLETPEALPR